MAEKLAFKTLARDEVFYLFNKRNKDLVELFRSNNVGGPSIIFDRYQEVGKKNKITLISSKIQRSSEFYDLFTQFMTLCHCFSIQYTHYLSYQESRRYDTRLMD